jgi:hypothetical protein
MGWINLLQWGHFAHVLARAAFQRFLQKGHFRKMYLPVWNTCRLRSVAKIPKPNRVAPKRVISMSLNLIPRPESTSSVHRYASNAGSIFWDPVTLGQAVHNVTINKADPTIERPKPKA